MFGVKISDDLNKKIQNSELSEIFCDLNLPDEFECDVPYSGDGYADIHLGIMLSNTSDKNNKPKLTPTKKQKTIYKHGVKAIEEQAVEIVRAWKNDFPENDYIDIENALNEMLKELKKNPEIYTAYSTS